MRVIDNLAVYFFIVPIKPKKYTLLIRGVNKNKGKKQHLVVSNKGRKV
jgi:hypothetical protein